MPTAAIRIEDVAAGLTTTEAVTARICALTTEIGLLRQYRTKLRRAERGGVMAAVKIDFEKGMSRQAICRKHRITLGQLTGCANRGGWQCGIRRRGHVSEIPPERMPEIRAAYETDPRLLREIAGDFGITRYALHYHAKQNGWVRLARPAASVAMPVVEMGNQVWP